MNAPNSHAPTIRTPLARKSWIAYAQIILLSIFFIVPAMYVLSVWLNPILAIGVLILTATGTAYQIAVWRSYQLYYNEDGVWLYYGVLPWTKGVRGVKWCDLDKAGYRPSMVGWLANSYTIVLTHRYTKLDEIVMTNAIDGNKAVMVVNRVLEKKVESNALG